MRVADADVPTDPRAAGVRGRRRRPTPDARRIRPLGLGVGHRPVDRQRPLVPRRRAARDRPHRGDRAARRLRRAAGDVPRADRRAAAARRAHAARSAAAAGADRVRPVGSDDVRVHRGGRRRALRGRGRRGRGHADRRGRRIRCRRSSRCCGRRCCRGWSTRRRTTGGASTTTCGCSRPARASAPPARRARGRGRVVRRAARRRTGPAPTRAADFYDVKGVVDALGRALGVELDYEPADVPYLVEGRTADVFFRLKAEAVRKRVGSASSARSRRRFSTRAASRRRTSSGRSSSTSTRLQNCNRARRPARRIAAALPVGRARSVGARR